MAVAVEDGFPFLVRVTEAVDVDGPAMVKDTKSRRNWGEKK